MSIQRFIHPSIWRSRQVTSMPPDAQLLFIGCFSTADDEGRRSADPDLLKADIFPLRDDIGPGSVRDLLRTCSDSGLIRIYGDGQWLDLPSWDIYQKPKYKKKSKIPEFRAESGPNPGRTRAESGPNCPGSGEIPAMGLGRVGLGLGRVGLEQAEPTEASGLPAAVSEKPEKPKKPKSRLDEVPDATLKLLIEFGEACSIKQSVVCQLLKRYAPDWLMGWMLYQLQQKPGNPVGYLHKCLKQRKTPPDELYSRARKLIEEREAITDKPPPAEVSAVTKKADTLPDGGSMNERRNIALDLLQTKKGGGA